MDQTLGSADSGDSSAPLKLLAIQRDQCVALLLGEGDIDCIAATEPATRNPKL